MNRVTEEGTGQFTHLGRVTFTLSHCAVIDFESGAGTAADGSMTIVAANGYQLALSYTATFQLEPWPNFTTADVHIDWMVTSGGTGRFAAATGSGEASLTPDFATGVSSSVWWGTIAY